MNLLLFFGDGKQLRDFVYIKDILPFFENAISNDFANNSIYNIGTGIGTTIFDIITQMSEILDIKLEIQHEPVRKGEIGNFYS